MQSVTLTRNVCPLCGNPTDPEWSGENPSLGTTCRNCFNRRDELFRPDNVELVAERQVMYNPLLGQYDYHFDFKGTKIMVNGKVGEVRMTYLGSSTVKFDDSKQWGTSIRNIDYWRLRDIYHEMGGEITPPPLEFPEYQPTKAELLEQPIFAVHTTEDGGTYFRVEVGDFEHGFPRFPMYHNLHAFCNMYVRWKFGLSPNFCAEGGFMGRGFEVRNFMTGSGINVSSHTVMDRLQHVTKPEDIRTMLMVHMMEGLSYDHEQSRDNVEIKDCTASDVVTVWTAVMGTLLRYDWPSMPYETVEDVWECFCRLQDVLLNILEPEALKESLAYAAGNTMHHAGCPF